VAADCVNTMPQATLDALIHHGHLRGDSITPSIAQSHQKIDSLNSLGINLDDVTHALEVDGVKKFKEAWQALLADVEKVLHS
jgi:transaldolase